MKADDHDLMVRSKTLPQYVQHRKANKVVVAIQNSFAQKELYVNVDNLEDVPVDYPNYWGKAIVEDRHGDIIEI